jgi:hypothetical protein
MTELLDRAQHPAGRRRPFRRSRALVLTAALVVGAAAIATAVAVTHHSRSCALAAGDVPQCGSWWGAALQATDSRLPAAVKKIEASSGRRLDIVHTYHRWYDVFPTAAETALADSGHQLMLNWEPVDRSGHPMSWASIGRGDQDAQIDVEAARLKALPGPVFVSFSHEPEYHWGSHGSAADFAAAFRAVVTRARADGATNVEWVWDVMGLQDPVWKQRYLDMWPGDAFVSWVAWDPYNWASCRPTVWRSFDQTVGPFYDWLEANGFGVKPFMLAEYGTVEDPKNPAAKANWFAGIASALHSMPDLRALLYFDLPSPPANCDWQLSTSTSSVHAWDTLSRSAPFAATARLSLASR